MMATDDIQANFPLHWLVWNNDFEELELALQSEKVHYQRSLSLSLVSLITGVYMCKLHINRGNYIPRTLSVH